MRHPLQVLPVLLLAAALLPAQEPAPPTQPESPASEPGQPGESALVVQAGTPLALILLNSVNTQTAQPGDQVYFETTYPVVVNSRVVIPAGSFVRGRVTQVKRPGRIKGRGELHVRFEELTLPNGYTTPLAASLAGAGTTGNEEVNRREGSVKGESTKSDDVTTVAGTTGAGAGIGAIAGRSGTGTAIGAGAGAAAGLAWVLLTRGRELVLPRGQTIEAVINRDLELDPALAKFEWAGQASPLPGADRRSGPRRRPVGSRVPF